MGRPAEEGEPRDVGMHLRVLRREREAWREAAKRKGVTLSEWIRSVLNRAAKRGAK